MGRLNLYREIDNFLSASTVSCPLSSCGACDQEIATRHLSNELTPWFCFERVVSPTATKTKTDYLQGGSDKMAKCSNCDSEIPFLAYCLSGFTNFRTNVRRSKCNPVVTCKHCGCQNVQESMSVLGGVVVVVASGLVILILARKTGHILDRQSYLMYGIPLIFLLQYVWWKFVTKLREP